MKSFFSGLKLGAPSPPPAGNTAQAAGLNRSTSQTDQHMPEMLKKAEKLLNKLRSSTQHDFPLLNEATRLGQHSARFPSLRRDGGETVYKDSPSC